MKKTFILTICFMMILTSSSYALNSMNTPSTEKYEDILSVEAGSNSNQVGYTPEMPEAERYFPESFDVLDNGKTIYILDTVNKRILKFEEKELTGTINLPFIEYAKDLIVMKNMIYVLEGNESNTVYQIDMKGTIINIINKPTDIESEYIRYLTLDKHNNLIVVYNGNKQYDLSNMKFVANTDVKIKSINSKAGKIIIDSSEINIPFEELYGSINIHNVTSEGDIYTSVEDVADTSKIIVEHTIRKFNKNGNLSGIAEIPMERYISFPNKYMDVSINGDIYIMILEEHRIVISKVNLKDQFKSKIKDKKEEYLKKEQENADNGDVVVSPMYDPSIPTRNEVNSRSNSMINYSWTYNSSNGQHSSYTDVTKPDYLINASYESSQSGIPYCWGGFDAHDRSSMPSTWLNFGDAMSTGKEAGNVYTSNNYKSSSAGLDCSGFVSAALTFYTKYGTYGLDNLSTPISTIQLKYMDILIKPGSHVLFFYSWNSDQTIVNSKEATTSGEDKTKNYTRTWSWLSSNNYQAKTFSLR